MWLVILEATAAFFIFAFIIWWTMYHGREPELNDPTEKSQTATPSDEKSDNANKAG
ncbi:MAG: hypothetical protein JWQ10_2956 [Herbaspirillum sp.]|jgi:hypothetical protein|nr:hypothetical protein [Herbaspirillum sp.]